MYTVIVKYGIYLFFREEICSPNTLFVNDTNIVESNCSQLIFFLQTLMLSFPHLATTDEQIVNVPPLCSDYTTYRRHFYAYIS